MNKKFKNKKLIKTICGLLVLCMALALWGCSPTEKDNTEEVATVNVSISIDYPAKAKKPDLKTLPFRAEEDSTVLQVVELYGNVNNMSILVDTTYSTLEGVDGVINGVGTVLLFFPIIVVMFFFLSLFRFVYWN